MQSPQSRTEALPPIVVPAACLIGGPSRFTNIYAPAPETIQLAEEVIAGQTATASVRRGRTRSLLDYRSASRKARFDGLLRKWRSDPVAQMGERLVYDARWVYNGNLAHLFGHHLGNLGFVRSTLELDPRSILIILEKNSPKLSHDFFSFMGYETCETDGVVDANVVEVDVDHTENYHLVPYISQLEPTGLDRSPGPERLFISRRTSRRILNEPDVLALCKERGYEAVYFESVSMAEQWRLVKQASSIVSIHGAALGYLNAKGAVPEGAFELLEIFSPGLVADCYRKITAKAGGFWVGCRGKVTSAFHRCVEESSNYKAMDADDFHLDIGALQVAFDKLPSRA